MQVEENLKWLRKGSTGCTFATLFSKNPDEIGWKFFSYQDFPVYFPLLEPQVNIVSIVFPEDWGRELVEEWASRNDFYTEMTSENTYGLRIKCNDHTSWVQYFGKDSHVLTRRSPYPMLMYTNRLRHKFYPKVGWKGILHLAHAWSDRFTKSYDTLWKQSYKQTKKLLGHTPTIKEAAKTTFLIK